MTYSQVITNLNSRTRTELWNTLKQPTDFLGNLLDYAAHHTLNKSWTDGIDLSTNTESRVQCSATCLCVHVHSILHSAYADYLPE